jgi:hypothetical protein
LERSVRRNPSGDSALDLERRRRLRQPAAEVELSFERTFTGSYRPGEPHDVMTIDPAGTGDTFDSAGIHLRVRLYCEFSGQPVVGELAVLFSSSLVGNMQFYASMLTDSGVPRHDARRRLLARAHLVRRWLRRHWNSHQGQ